jgi:hypothetical protein
MRAMLAAALFLSPVTSADLEIGPAAYFAPAFDYGGWDAIIAAHASAGQIDAATFRYSPDGFYCVSPDHALGDRLAVINAVTGASVVCTVADTVAAGDLAHWRASVVIELSWAAFVAAGGREHNRFAVLALEGVDA